MRANFVVLSALTAAVLLNAAAASATVLTVTPAAPVLGGVSAAGAPDVAPAATFTNILSTNFGSTSTTVTEKVVQTAPTTTSSGLAYVYDVTTVNNTRTDTLGSADFFYWSQALTGNTPGNEFLTFSATVTGTSPLSATLSIYSSGSYTPVASPFGTSVPALPSYYFRLAGTSAWTLLGSSSGTSAESSTYGGESAAVALNVTASTSFEVAVFAGSNVDLSNVSVSLVSAYYDVHDLTTPLGSTVTKTLVGAELLAPVPEPETYALILAGLLFVSLRVRAERR